MNALVSAIIKDKDPKFHKKVSVYHTKALLIAKFLCHATRSNSERTFCMQYLYVYEFFKMNTKSCKRVVS